MTQALKENNYISVVAVLDSKSNDPDSFITQVTQFCSTYFNDYELIFVDNNAPKRVIEQLKQQLNNTAFPVHLIHLPHELNKEQAVLAGVAASIGDFVFEFEDIKIDYTAADLWQLYQTCLRGNDIALLKPITKSNFIENFFYQLLMKYAHQKSLIYQSRVHLISRRAINRVNMINTVIHYRKYAYCNAGLPYAYVDYQSTEKRKYASLSFQKMDYATDLLILYTTLAKRITLLLGVSFALFSVLGLIYTLIVYATVNVVHGWTTLMLFISLSFTGLFLCMSIIIKYLNILIRHQQTNLLVGSKQKI